MLHVASPLQAKNLLKERFGHLFCGTEHVPLAEAYGRILAGDICAPEDIPGFVRSTVDGYAVRAADTFGCSESLPSMLAVAGEVLMGQPAGTACGPAQCVAVPTGGQVPRGANAVVMVEHTEDYGDGSIGVTAPVAPGQSIICAQDDVAKGQTVLKTGKRLAAADIGALAAMGIADVPVAKRPIVGILSTGDELVTVRDTPEIGQVRDVNAGLLAACIAETGGLPKTYGICPDDCEQLLGAVDRMARECDAMLLSGGSSAGAKDAVRRAVEQLGTLLLHGIAIKPGKPTVVGEVAGKPLIGLPGHPVAAYFVYTLFAAPMLAGMMQAAAPLPKPGWRAILESAIPSNHGREEYVAVNLLQAPDGLRAVPVISKSGLITQLSKADGYLKIPRDCEGYAAGAEVEITAL